MKIKKKVSCKKLKFDGALNIYKDVSLIFWNDDESEIIKTIDVNVTYFYGKEDKIHKLTLFFTKDVFGKRRSTIKSEFIPR